MKRLLVCSPKGGCGKTMVSRNLAVAAARDGAGVATLDLDPQGTLTRWWNRRGDEVAAIIHYQVAITEAPAAMAEIVGHDLLVIDTPTAVEEHPAEIKALILAADFVLIPSKATIDDIESTSAMMKLVRSYGRPAAYVVNMVKPRAKSVAEVKRELNKTGRLCPIEIGDREDMHRVAVKGLGILEVGRHPGADEVDGVWQFVKNEMGYGDPTG